MGCKASAIIARQGRDKYSADSVERSGAERGPPQGGDAPFHHPVLCQFTPDHDKARQTRLSPLLPLKPLPRLIAKGIRLIHSSKDQP